MSKPAKCIVIAAAVVIVGSLSKTFQRAATNPVVRVWISNDEAYFLREVREKIEVSGLSYRALKPRLRDTEPNAPRYAVFSASILPVYMRPTAARDRAIARLAGARLFVGLHAYRNRFGSYPASLDELREKLNWRLPTDPFSGKPFAYRRKGSGFVLYSIGEDLKDNGGVEPKANKARTTSHPPPGPPPKGGADERSGDIVWKRDR